MLELRDKIKPFVSIVIGDGKSTSIWYDPWYHNEPLANYITRRDIYDARLNNYATIADMIQDGKWIWPSDWRDKFPLLNSARSQL